MTGALGIIAGGGELPRAIARAHAAAGRAVFVLALAGMTGEWANGFPARMAWRWASWAERSRRFKAHGCTDVTLAGKVQRPEILRDQARRESDARAPRVIAAALKGDDALLRSVVDMFEREGFRVVGAGEAAPDLHRQAGRHGTRKAHVRERGRHRARLRDRARHGRVRRRAGGHRLRGAHARRRSRGRHRRDDRARRASAGAFPRRDRQAARRAGEGAEADPGRQDRSSRHRRATPCATSHAAALAGIAVEAGGALIVDRDAVVAEADRLGLFLIGSCRVDGRAAASCSSAASRRATSSARN